MYNVSFTLKTSVLLFLLLFWIIVRSEDYYNDYEDGSNFNVGDTNYLGVTVIVYLLNSTILYCMGLLVNDLNVTYTGTQDFQYVLTSAGCVVHDWLNEIRVCIKGNPYINQTNENMREVVRFIVHPKYNDEKHTGDIVLIRMDKIVRSKTHKISDQSPIAYHEKDMPDKSIGVFLWANGQKNLPHKLVQKNVILKQWQNVFYSMNVTRCPLSNDTVSPENVEEKIWYMFMCTDYMSPTRNEITNPGAQVFHNDSIIAIYSYSCEKPLQRDNSDAPGYNKNPKLKVTTSQIHRYTLLYWYRPWIQYTITADKRHKINDLYKGGNGTTKIVTPKKRKPTTTTVSSFHDYFDIDSPYDDVPLGANPCSAANRVLGLSRRPIPVLRSVGKFLIYITIIIRY